MEDKVIYRSNFDTNEDRKIERVKQLALIMKDAGLTRLEYTADMVVMERPPEGIVMSTVPSTTMPPSATIPHTGGHIVKSPMVGVFYSAPSSDKESYVSVGDTVNAGDVLCIIEAMKMMNEITAEYNGVIAEIFCLDKDVVEFGQPLFRINTGDAQ